jgi:hypothetical protein
VQHFNGNLNRDKNVDIFCSFDLYRAMEGRKYVGNAP